MKVSMKQTIFLFFILISFFSYSEEKKINAVWYNVYQINIANIKEAKAQIDMHFRTMNELGINTIFFMVKSPNGRAYYKSKILKPVLNNDYVTNKNSENSENFLEVLTFINEMSDSSSSLHKVNVTNLN